MFPRIAVLLISLATAAAAQAGAEAYFEEKAFDFGPTPRGPQLVHHFRFTNKGDAPVSITRIRSSCNCITATAPAEKVKPGESAAVTIRMDTRRFAGAKTETVYVVFAGPPVEEVPLKVQAQAREEFTLSPDKFAFGKVGKGTAATATVRATLAGDPAWEVSEAKADSEHVKVAVKKGTTKGAYVTYEITATLAGGLPAGRFETDVWLKTSNADVGKVRIPVAVEVGAAVSASPSAVAFGEVKVGQAAERNVLVRGEKPFRIKSIKGADAGVEVSGAGDEAKAVHVLKVAFKPQKPGDVSRSVEIVGEDGSAVAVTVTGTGVGE